MVDRVGQQFGNYQLIRLLGQGSFADVYLGEHRYLRSLAALKILRLALAEQEQQRFLSEAQTLARLIHPGIVRVLEFALEQGIPVLVTEYASEGTLRKRYPRGTQLPLPTIVSYIKQAASALQYAHNRGIIHRDVKPENMLLNLSHNILLSDFGLALLAASISSQLSSQECMGTLAYAAPEQLRGKPCFASDQYSLAVIAYEWLCGKRPFEGSMTELMYQHTSIIPPALSLARPDLPPAVEAVIQRALAKEPRERFASVQAFAHALARSLEEYPHYQDDEECLTQNVNMLTPGHSKGSDLSGIQSSLPGHVSSVPPTQTTAYMTPMPANAGPLIRQTQPIYDVRRERLLTKVQTFWIGGVLHHSLHNGPLLKLGLRSLHKAVENPWQHMLQESGTSTLTYPMGTRILDIYDQAGGELLILGGPGSGKTTLLLDLARDLIERARSDEHHPLPVIFNLSSWVLKRQSLADWMVDELHGKYQVPRKLSQTWIKKDLILPLLDGLDEVSTVYRSACISAINNYRRTNGLVPTVICCRQTDYFAQENRILLRQAVVVQNLTEQQIQDYLQYVGLPLQKLQKILQDDSDLRALVTTPLMLSIMALACQNSSSAELFTADNPDVRRLHIFSSYIQRMLERRGDEHYADLPKTLRWLSHLAQQLRQHNLSIFYIEQVQPAWLEDRKAQKVYERMGVRWPAMVIGALVCFAVHTLLFGFGIFPAMMHILIGCLLGRLYSSSSRDLNTQPMPAIRKGSKRASKWNNKYFVQQVARGTLMRILMIGWIWLYFGLSFTGLFTGLLFGAISLLLNILLSREKTRLSVKEAGERSTWSSIWRRVTHRRTLRNGFLTGLCCGLGFGLSFAPTSGLSTAISITLGEGLSFGLGGSIVCMLLMRQDGQIHPAESIRWSFRSLRHSLLKVRHLLNSLFICLLIVFLTAPSYGLSIGLGKGPHHGLGDLFSHLLAAGSTNIFSLILSYGLSFGLSKGISFGLIYWGLIGLFSGVSSKPASLQDKRQTLVVKHGIRRSFYNSLLMGTISGGISGLAICLYTFVLIVVNYELNHNYRLPLYQVLLKGMDVALVTGLYLGLICALLVFLLMGGLACLRHLILRFLLWRQGYMPWNYQQFLNYATERILLHKEGNGYAFPHPLWLDYFASLEEDTIMSFAVKGGTQRAPGAQEGAD